MYPQEMITEMDAMMMALLLVANIIGIVAVSIFAVYAIGLATMALSDKLQQLRRASLPKLHIGQMKPSAVRTVLQ